MSWDDDDDGDGSIVAKVDEKVKNAAWDDEDKAVTNLDSWEDVDKPAEPEKPKPQPGARKSKTQAEIKQEKAEKLAKERAAAAEAAKIDPAEAKRRQQKLIEDSDMDSTRDLFGDVSKPSAANHDGDDSTTAAAAAPAAAPAPDPLAALASKTPKDEAEFDAFAESVAKLVTAHQNNFHYMRLVKTLVKNCTVSFKSEEYKDLSAHLNVLLNAQLAKEKKADGKKPKKSAAVTTTKKKLQEDFVDGEYDDYNF